MNLLEAKKVLDRVRDVATAAGSLKREVGREILGIKKEKQTLTIWTETAMIICKDECFVLRKR